KPDANFIRQALEKCPLVIVSDIMGNTDSLKYAHIALPAQGWGEKDGTVTNSERRLSRQRPFLSAPAESRPDWWIISEVAKHMGFAKSFDYKSPNEIFREHAALSAFENNGTRDFDISGLGYDFAPVQWPVNAANPTGKSRFFEQGNFYTKDKRARFIAVRAQAPVNDTDQSYPLILNSGRIRDQWHTMTRTGKSPRLNAHREEPYITIHPVDAKKHDLGNNGFVRIFSQWGKALARVRLTNEQQAGQIFMPLHWSDATTANAATNRLVNPVTDPLSGQPELKHTPVRLEKWSPKWHGFLLSRKKIMPEHMDYWCHSYQKNCHILELASRDEMQENSFLAPYLARKNDADILSFSNPASGQIRLAHIEKGRLDFCLFVSDKGNLPDRSWLQSLFQQDSLTPEIYRILLSGQPGGPEAQMGPVICSCYGVSQKAILSACRQRQARTVDDIGNLLQAGRNCGACKPEIKDLISQCLVG
ncbi:Assimilatory nitrate reductase large subunit, partial [hydrothermal vent metagenome]